MGYVGTEPGYRVFLRRNNSVGVYLLRGERTSGGRGENPESGVSKPLPRVRGFLNT